MSRHHTPIFSNAAKQAFRENSHHYTKEVIFFEWMETPINYESPKQKRRREKTGSMVKEPLEPTGPIAQAIMGGILGACIIGAFVLELFF